MKKRILIVLLCVACVGAYAQKKQPKKSTRKPNNAAAAGRRTTPPPPQPSNTVTSQAVPMDTTKKPMKPFERPLDGYYKKGSILNCLLYTSDAADE